MSTTGQHIAHQKSRSVTDPALVADPRATTLKTLGTKIFKDRVSSNKKSGQNSVAPVDSFSAGLSKYSVLDDKASRLLGTQHALSADDRTLLQLPEPANQKPDGIIFSGSLSPTKSGTYGTVGRAQLEVPNSFARVKSHRGLVADIEDDEGAQNTHAPHEEVRSSVVYSPSVYGGVWECHPSVVSPRGQNSGIDK